MTSFQALLVGKVDYQSSSPARLQNTLIDDKNLLTDVTQSGQCLVLYLL